MKQYVHMMLSAIMSTTEEADIYIYGYITPYKWDETDVTASEIQKELGKVKDAKTIRVHINSPGGSVYQGESIMDNLLAHKATAKEGYIEGLSASAATLPLLAMTKVFAYEGSEVMIHNPSSWGWGTAKDLQKAVDSLLLTQKNICRLYAKRFKKSEEEVQKAMDDESWYDAQGAKDFGIVDEIIPIVNDSASMAATISKSQMMMLGYKKVPEAVMGRLPEKEPDVTPSAACGRHLPQEGGLIGESAAKAAFSNTENKGEKTMDGKTMTADELRTQHPDIVAQIEAAAKTAGATEERARIQGLEDVAMVGSEKLLAEAKFEKPCSVADFAINQAKNAKAKGATFMGQRQAETKGMEKVGSGEGTADLTEDQEADNEAKAMLAAAGIKPKA